MPKTKNQKMTTAPEEWARCPLYNINFNFTDIRRQTHLLIGGTTGSGKSVLINGIISNLLHFRPDEIQLVLIDPKRVELRKYKDLPHVVGYASEPGEIVSLLQYCLKVMDDRYKRAAELGLTEAPHTQLYIIIDELADLMTTNKKQIEPMLARLAQLGRAARMHIIAATQNPSRKIITAPIKVNMPSSVALRCRDKIESKMLIGDDSALSLPMYGYGVYLTPSMPEPLQIPIPLVRPDYIKQQIDWWRQEERRYNKLINRIRRLFYIR